MSHRKSGVLGLKRQNQGFKMTSYIKELVHWCTYGAGQPATKARNDKKCKKTKK